MVAALKFPSDLEGMNAAADIRRHEVEAVRRERAQDDIEGAVVRDTARGDVTKEISADLLKALVVDHAGRACRRRKDGLPVKRDIHTHGRGLRGGGHIL